MIAHGTGHPIFNLGGAVRGTVITMFTNIGKSSQGCNITIQGTASSNFFILSAKSNSILELIRNRFAAELSQISPSQEEFADQELIKEYPAFRYGHCVSQNKRKQPQAVKGRGPARREGIDFHRSG